MTDEAGAKLLAACKAQHEVIKAQHAAIDWLLACLIHRDPTFFPSESPVWPAVVLGSAAIKKAESEGE